MERANDEGAKFDAMTFDLATGAKIRIQIDEFWEQLLESDLRLGHQPKLYFAIRIYSDEETNPRRMVRHTEFRAGNDFEQSCIPRLAVWLSDLTTSRHRFTYDRVEDFTEEFSARMEEFAVTSDDAADYLYKTHGLAPAYENPPHTEFPEDHLSLQSQTEQQASSASSAVDLECDDDSVGFLEPAGVQLRVSEESDDEL